MALFPMAVQLQQQLFALRVLAVTAAGYSSFGHLYSTEEIDLRWHCNYMWQLWAIMATRSAYDSLIITSMFFCKCWTFLPTHWTSKRWTLAKKINGLKRWRYNLWQGICKNVEIRVQTSVFPGGKILNSCTLPLQWPLPQQSSFCQNDLTLVVQSPSLEPKWENEMALTLLTHLVKWNRKMRSQGLVICAELMQQALLGCSGLEQYLARNS